MKKIVIIILLCLALCLQIGCAGGDSSETYAPDYLILVNKQNLIDMSFADTLKLAEIPDVEGGYDEVEETTYNAYMALHDALLKEGIEIGVDSAFRSVEKQQQIMDEFIEEYGEEYAKATVAEPGTSEHHTGFAVDIVPKVNSEWVIENEDMLKETEIFAVIHKMLPDYGFIVRYPEGKEDITGYSYEPWHLRYVGTNAAREIFEKGLTLEEYLQKEK